MIYFVLVSSLNDTNNIDLCTYLYILIVRALTKKEYDP